MPLIISWEADPEPEGSLPAREMVLVLGSATTTILRVMPTSCHDDAFSEVETLCG